MLGESNCIRAKWVYSGKIVVFGQSGCFGAKGMYFGKSNCIRVKWLYSVKSGYIRAKLLYRANWLCLGKIGSIWAYSL